jgi:ABC-2 type transport system permease protein
MRCAFLVAWREYAENARTKGFWIGIFLLPVILFLSGYVPVLLERQGKPTRHFVLVDKSGKFEKTVENALEKRHQRRVLDALREYAMKQAQPHDPAARRPAAGARDALKELADPGPDAVDRFIRRGGKEFYLREIESRLKPGAPGFEEPKRQFQLVPLPADVRDGSDLSVMAQALKPYLRGERKIDVDGRSAGIFAAILIPADVERQILRPGLPGASTNSSPGGIEYWSGNLADDNLRDEVQGTINAEVRRREYVTRGMDLALIEQVEGTRVPFASLNPKKEEGQEKVSGADVLRQWAPVAFVYLLWIAIFSIMQMLLNNVIEEKSNRIIEVLLSSVTPGELMMGKLAGIAAVGMTMVGAWLLSLVGILAWKAGAHSEVGAQLYSVVRTSNLLPAFVIYFFFGYLMYAALILALGSVCNTLKEAQNYMGMITMIMTVPLLTMMFIPKDPNGTLATALSWVPLYTPFIMMNRAAADPPLFDLVGTMILLIVTTVCALWMSVKVFRIGVLRAGQPPKLVELLRWIRRGS